ncbi:MAG: hypothetical protein B7Y36_18820 [Novosphingobium sp. 28-62-57]|uniref:hypothetical protein n=1 Tax=Novosphingobium sp. 28-62-57 TaxID=1970409 RepID=UPI000BD3C70D|nr:hypothetical protein [Novosphingobium sp. 28-62-57]OYW50736.1 MAG: hypothetical protein B7Z34_02615 [Novosphingobium sp. 12-62-10]OYZ07771.1 MAG: hypothetical protein B7Y36_18820 [Novosphingobium sp. 28-62-57]HQS70676.1 hypothetical protein [Novosphingobium sp.]
MAKTDIGEYDITCKHCNHDFTFRISDVPGLDDDIADDEQDACDAEADRTRLEFVGYIDPDELTGQRLFLDIAAALRRRDVGEAAIALERLATEMGWHACDEVNRGLHTSIPLFERVS